VVQELEKALERALVRSVIPRALVVINPGNPTGNSLPLENMQAVVRFCSKHNLVLLADEVYQENIYDSSLPFHSFKKVPFPSFRPSQDHRHRRGRHRVCVHVPHILGSRKYTCIHTRERET
jgi:aspartate/methionine/tyrosine aminotransferase